MNAAVKKILTVLFSLLVISYVGYQAYGALYNPLKTIRATSGTYEDSIRTKGLVLHQETVINSNQNGVIDYVRDNGENVDKYGEVAYVYQTEQDVANQRKIQSLTSQIKGYQQTGNSATAESIDIDVLSSEIEKSFLGLSAAADTSQASSIAASKADMLTLLNKKQLATGEVTNFDSQIAKLQNEIDELSKRTNAKIGTIYTPEAGYFVSSTDGFENAYDFSKVPGINAANVARLLTAKVKPQTGAVGKIISNYVSYIVCNLSANDAYTLHVGDSVQIRFLLSAQPEVPVTIEAINKDSSGVAVVFKCTTMTSSFSTIRRQDMEIITDSYTGIKVLDSFVHVVNGTKGVFVRSGSLVKFEKLDPIYSAAGYVVSGINSSDSDYLQVYDEVIENGDDLYDGEIIK